MYNSRIHTATQHERTMAAQKNANKKTVLRNRGIEVKREASPASGRQ